MLNKILIIITAITIVSCGKDNSPKRVEFSLSASTMHAYESVDIIHSGDEGVEFFIDSPSGFQSEVIQSTNALTEVGTYRITQLGFNDNYQEVEVYPNLIVWSNFNGNIIEVDILSLDDFFLQEGQVICIENTAPTCSTYTFENCAFFSLNPSHTYELIASDGVNTWSSNNYTIVAGECNSLLLQE